MNMKTIATTLIGFMLLQVSLGQEHLGSYSSSLQTLETQRVQLQERSGSEELYSQCSDRLFQSLTKEILPAWLGTPWDFNGTSNSPNQGQIACGYFVSTTLKHAGFNLNRYRLAQQDATTIAKAFSANNSVDRINEFDQLVLYLKKKRNAIYICGLEYHVGFIVVEEGKSYFFHSDYVNNKVVREALEESFAMRASQVHVLAELTDNNELMKKWIHGHKIY